MIGKPQAKRSSIQCSICLVAPTFQQDPKSWRNYRQLSTPNFISLPMMGSSPIYLDIIIPGQHWHFPRQPVIRPFQLELNTQPVPSWCPKPLRAQPAAGLGWTVVALAPEELFWLLRWSRGLGEFPWSLFSFPSALFQPLNVVRGGQSFEIRYVSLVLRQKALSSG